MGLVALALAAVAAPLSGRSAGHRTSRRRTRSPRPWQGTIGMRGTLIRSNGFDPFSTTDMLPQISLSLQHPFARQGAFGVAAGVGMDYGEANADARGTPVDVQGLAAVRRARGTVLPAAVRLRVRARRARDAARGRRAERRLQPQRQPAGRPLRLAGGRRQRRRGVPPFRSREPGRRLALRRGAATAGPAATTSSSRPAAPPRDQAKLAAVDLGTIDPRGAFMRLALAVTY